MLTRRPRPVIPLVLMILVVIPQLGCTAKETYTPTFESAPCPVDYAVSYRVDCGYLRVPAKRAQPQGPTVKVATAIFRSTGAQVQPDPVIFIVGGPGSHLLQPLHGLAPMIQSWLWTRDVIFVDQRGIGLSQPALTCPDYDHADLSDLSTEDAEAQAVELLQNCADTLAGQGIDLSAFNTLENADDLADLPVALGYQQANYYGLSYGADVILNVLRRHPEVVRSAILEGVSPPDISLEPSFPSSFEHALREVIAACAEDADCHAAYPNFEPETFFALLQQWNDQPITVPVPHPQTGEVVDAVISGDSVLNTFHSELYYPANVKYMPAWIDALATGHADRLIPFLQSELTTTKSTASNDDTGAFYSYRCSDDVLGRPPEEFSVEPLPVAPVMQNYWRPDLRTIQQRCAIWPVRPASPEAAQPVVSDIPVLMFSGRFDPVTPAYFADHVLETLSHGYHYVFPSMGHGVGSSGSTCAARISVEFLATPAAAPDAQCVEHEPAIDFVILGE